MLKRVTGSLKDDPCVGHISVKSGVIDLRTKDLARRIAVNAVLWEGRSAARTLVLHTNDRGFESHLSHPISTRSSYNLVKEGSIPSIPAKKLGIVFTSRLHPLKA